MSAILTQVSSMTYNQSWPKSHGWWKLVKADLNRIKLELAEYNCENINIGTFVNSMWLYLAVKWLYAASKQLFCLQKVL